MNEQTKGEVRAAVREQYSKVARQTTSSTCAPGCCGGSTSDVSLKLGHSVDDLAAGPEGANMGLGCGNPQGPSPHSRRARRSSTLEQEAASTASSPRSRWGRPGV